MVMSRRGLVDGSRDDNVVELEGDNGEPDEVDLLRLSVMLKYVKRKEFN